MHILALFIAFVAGIAMAVQGSINAALGKITGLLEATFIVHIVGTIAVVILLFILRLGSGDLSNAAHAPWYLYLGGLFGVIIVYGVVASIPRLGVATATTSIIVGQVGMALVIDHFGFFGLERVPFSWFKAAGVGLLAVGAKLMLMK
ncbi:MAG: DMT family transporter [Dethiobacter sp.]|jgi:transporter family-2 protein|nr:DMT family transporter [Dethiobacter sp.]